MAKKQNPENFGLVMRIAEQLGVNIKDGRLAIATDNQKATVRFSDGSLEATLVPLRRPTVRINSPRNPGVYIEMVDHQQDILAPGEAIYCVNVYMPDPNNDKSTGTMLKGDINRIYIGNRGILLDEAGRRRAKEL